MLRLLGFLLWETLRVGNACALRLRGALNPTYMENSR